MAKVISHPVSNTATTTSSKLLPFAISIAESDTVIDGEAWRKVTITVANAASLQPGEVWKQPIVFKNGDELTRTVNFTLRRPMTLTVDMQDVVDGVKDTQCELKFSIPSGLTIYRFPSRKRTLSTP